VVRQIAKNLDERCHKRKYIVEFSDMLPTQDKLQSEMDNNSLWETIKEIIKIHSKGI
jgi:hypothetical protein